MSTKFPLSIGVVMNPIVRGKIQIITITVTNNIVKKVAGTDVEGELLYVSGFIHKFSSITNNLGQVIYSWRISVDADTGQFTVTVIATKAGYDQVSATTTFTVMPKS
jgi:hypothetical protein